MSSKVQDPKIVAFVSYKGGVGRTLTLANIAYALAIQGKRVGCIDIDLDAPGLNITFGLVHKPNDLHSVANLLLRSAIFEVENAIVDVCTEGKGGIYLLPASDAPEVVEKIQWSISDGSILRQICNRFAMLKDLDLILIDAKAGLGKSSGLALSVAQLMVCVLRIDRQCREGSFKMDRVFKALGKKVIYIASMVPNSNKAESILNDLKNQLEIETEIPYSTSVVIDEKVVMRDSPRIKTAQIYTHLANRILNTL